LQIYLLRNPQRVNNKEEPLDRSGLGRCGGYREVIFLTADDEFMTTVKSVVYRFADVEVDEREFSVIKAGEVLAVEPKAFQVLIYLLRNPQRLISKEELMNAVWGDAAVTENSLTRSILKLRRLLGDETRNPIYIETVATVGYRLVCRVEVLEAGRGRVEAPARQDDSNAGASSLSHANEVVADAAKEPSGQVVSSTGGQTKSGIKEKGSRTRRWRLLVAAAAVVVCVGAAVWYLQRPLPLMRISTYTQVTRDRQRKALIGTDGTRLFFNDYTQAATILAEESVTGGGSVPIPVTLPDPWVHDVSPDGTELLVASGNGVRQILWRVGAEGGSLRQIADGDIEGAGWSPNGESVAYSTSNGDIHVVRSDGTGARVLGTVPHQTSNADFERVSWSPDGTTIRFDRNNRIYEVSLDGSGPRVFLPDWRPESWQCCGRWTPDGKFFLFLEWDLPLHAYPLVPPYQIWALDERGKQFWSRGAEPFQLTSGPTRWARPVPARNGGKIFARGINLDGRLERVDARSHQIQPYLGGISAEGVSFSRDGKFVAYVTYPDGILWKANRDGSNRTQLTDPPLYPVLPRWSPDGAQILFSAADAAGKVHSYIVSSTGGAPQPILPGFKYDTGGPFWSPDGHRIVFDSWNGEGEAAKHITQILDVASHQLTTLPGENYAARWSPQGRFLAGQTHGTGELALFDFKAGRWSVVQKGRADYPTWSHDGQYVYFLRMSGDAGVYRIRPAGGQAERIVDLKGFQHAGYFGLWMGLDPEDNPLLLRNVGGDDIYALVLEER
jgi:DNA-binding winged helix-turn-helix (wHTH) protein/Tol biopolymer transport system component